MKRIAKLLLLAVLAAGTAQSAAATGSIRSIVAVDYPENAQRDYGPNNPIRAGETLAFKVRLLNFNTNLTHIGSLNNPWGFRPRPGVDAALAAANPPGMGLWIGGRKRLATLKRTELAATYYTDLLFAYEVQSGDLAQPVLFCDATGTSEATNSPDQNYLLENVGPESYWELTDKATGTNCVFRFGDKDLVPSSTDHCNYPPSGWTAASEVRDYDFSKADIHIDGRADIVAEAKGWTGAYDGRGHGVDVRVSNPADGCDARYALGDSSGPTNDWSLAKPLFTNVCAVTVYVELSEEGYAPVTNHADVTITNAPLTIAAKDQTYAYNGQSQGEGDTAYATPDDIAEKVAVSGLAPGDGLASIILDGQGTDPGTYPLVPSGATVTNAVGAYVTDNYAIGYTNGTLTIREPPPFVSNVVARQRWPWNGLVDVDYEVGGYTEGLAARISFAASDGRSWVATNFLPGAEASAEPGFHRATWDTKADGATNVVAAEVVATVELIADVARVSISIVNACKLANAPVSCWAVVGYGNGESNDLCVVVRDIAYDNETGKATFHVVLEGGSAELRSVTLFDDRDCAFEWYDFNTPKKVHYGDSVTCDIADITPYQGGTGTKDDPYLIANPAQLGHVRDHASDDVCYKVVKDILFQGSCGITIVKGDDGQASLGVANENARFYDTGTDCFKGWLPIGVYSVNAQSGEESNCEGLYFKGSFDGGGFLIDDLYIWADRTYGGTSMSGDQGLTVGLFGQCVSATIANVRIGDHSAIHAYTDKNLSVGAVVGGSMNRRGYLFGYEKDTGEENHLRTFVTGCSSAAYVDSYGYSSSATGGVGGSMNDCIAGGCSNLGEIVVHAGLEKAKYTAVGGCFGEICNSKCITDADSWSQEVQRPVVMRNLFNEGAITVTSDRLEGWPSHHVGGIVGYGYHVSLDGGANAADLTFAEEVETNKARSVYQGGVVGCMEGPGGDSILLNNLSNTGDITTTVKCFAFCYVGGIAGQISNTRASINRCCNSGQISATNGDWQNVGGIAGYSSGGEYVGCVNIGEVRAYGRNNDSYDYLGGIAGYLECDYESSVSACFNMGNVSGTIVKLAGGIAGGYCDQTAVAINGCLACGDFNVDATPGGILGRVSNDRLTAGHNAFLKTSRVSAADPTGSAHWTSTLTVADESVLKCEAEAAEGKRLHEFLNLDDESFDWVKSTAAEGVPAGYPVPAWYDSASH